MSKQHYSVVVLDTSLPGNGSSIKNQAWLHKGSFYALDRDMANLCQRGFQRILSDYGATVHMDIQAYYLYSHLEHAEEHIANCRMLDIDARLIQARQIEAHEPILRGSRRRYGVHVPDLCFNNSQYVQAVANQACKLGTRFYPVDRLMDITGDADRDGSWHLYIGGNREIICNFIILSCGALIPAMLKKLSPGQNSGLIITKTPVLALKSDTPIANSMLLTNGENPDLHIVPFRSPEARGVTVCSGGMQQDAIDHEDSSLHPEWQERFLNNLQDYYPSLRDTVAANGGILTYPYSCYKVEQERDRREKRANRQPLCEIYTRAQGAAGNIATIYPGKLTHTPLLWELFGEKLEPLLGDRHTTILEGTEAPTIARQPYHDDAPYLLVVQNGELTFKKIDRAQ